MTLSIGQVVDSRYRIVKLLGQGGFGAVYEAWDTRLERPCALKENLASSPEAEKQFGKEATILANLNHPNLPRVIDHFAVPGQGQYLVMDFVEGEDLQQMLDRRGPLPEGEVLPWIAQTCDALAYLHGQPQPIIHRDVKPANIKIAPDGHPMLVDFGIAKLYDPALRTMLGARAITPGYSPPEQYGHGRTDIRSDIYSLGATLYALLTGEEPADSVERLIGAAALTPPKQLNPLISEPAAQVIMKALAAEPAQRFQSAEEFKRALTADSLVHSTVAPARSARPAPPAVGARVPPGPGVRPDSRAANILAILAMLLGFGSWIFSCVNPIVLMQFETSSSVAFLAFGSFGLGCLSVPVALVLGGLVLTKYRKAATGWDRLMVIFGLIAVVALVFLVVGLVVLVLLFPSAGT
ncbi:MAG: serine/threonine protein kinase [Anaerolineae bacterium]|nr:serine/threonine protein kinase [Anaerolineae bacterium]